MITVPDMLSRQFEDLPDDEPPLPAEPMTSRDLDDDFDEFSSGYIPVGPNRVRAQKSNGKKESKQERASGSRDRKSVV